MYECDQNIEKAANDIKSIGQNISCIINESKKLLSKRTFQDRGGGDGYEHWQGCKYLNLHLLEESNDIVETEQGEGKTSSRGVVVKNHRLTRPKKTDQSFQLNATT